MSMKKRSLGSRLLFAASGFAHGVRGELSMRVHIAAVALVLLALIVLRPAPIWWAVVALACAGVIAAELFNTAIEHLADHVQPDLHPTIRIVKDCAAAAVLVSAIGAIAVAVALLVEIARPFRAPL